MRKIVSYIIDNRDYVTFFITIILSLLILTNNQSENIQNIKSKFGFINYYLNLPNMIFSDLFYLKEKNKLLNEQIININLENSKLEHLIVENNRLKSLLGWFPTLVFWCSYLGRNVLGAEASLGPKCLVPKHPRG